MRRHLAFSVLIASFALAPAAVRADAAADRRAELERKKAEAKKKAEERRKAAAAANAGAGGSTAAGGSTGTGGTKATTTSTGGASSGGASSAAGGAASKGGTGGTGGTGGAGTKSGTGGAAGSGGAGGATTKTDEKDAPLPTADIASLRKDRPERRKVTVERLRRRWGSLLANDKGAAELKAHARRIAFLQRVRVVADAKKDAKTVEAVDVLLTQEDERHGNAMNALREGALPTGAKP